MAVHFIINRFNVQMNRQLDCSSNYDSNKNLIQTFGRGNLPRLLEPNLSERNTFEQEKHLREKYSYHQSKERKNKKIMNADDNLSFMERKKQTKEAQEMNFHKNKKQLEDIDEINTKINGLIKSISMSCQKKVNIQISKTQNLEKSESIQNFRQRNHKNHTMQKILQNKYNLHNNQSDHRKERNFDTLKRNQKAKWMKESIETKSSLTQREYSNLNQRGNKQKKIQNQIIINRDQQEVQIEQNYLQQRIQKINDKITEYERKMSTKHFGTPVFNHEKSLKQQSNYQNVKSFKTIKLDESNLSQNIRKKQLRQKNRHPRADKQNEERNFKDNILSRISQNQKLQYFRQKYKINEQSSFKKQQSKELKSHINISKLKVNQELQTQRNFKKQKELNIQDSIIQKRVFDKLSLKTTFVKAVVKQISLDQDFRHAKHMFGGIEGLFGQISNGVNEKWYILRNELKKQGVLMNINEVKQIFMPRDDQIDPFMSVSHCHDELIHGLIFAYQASQKHWHDHVYRCWTLWELKQSNFTAQNIDRGKKGYIALEDLTFYINTEVDGNYRNRDLMLIFYRLVQSHSLKLEHRLKFKGMMDRLLSL